MVAATASPRLWTCEALALKPFSNHVDARFVDEDFTIFMYVDTMLSQYCFIKTKIAVVVFQWTDENYILRDDIDIGFRGMF